MGTIAPALAFLTTVVAVGSSAMAAIGQQQQASYQGQVAKQNANIEEQNRQASLQEAAAQESIERTNTGRRLAGALAAQGASGIDVNYGSPQEVRGALANEGDLDAQAIRYNASRRALGYINTRAGFLGDKAMYKASARNAVIGGAFDVGSSFLSSSSSIQRRSNAQASVGLG